MSARVSSVSAKHSWSSILSLNENKSNVGLVVLSKKNGGWGGGGPFKATVINPKHQSDYSH